MVVDVHQPSARLQENGNNDLGEDIDDEQARPASTGIPFSMGQCRLEVASYVASPALRCYLRSVYGAAVRNLEASKIPSLSAKKLGHESPWERPRCDTASTALNSSTQGSPCVSSQHVRDGAGDCCLPLRVDVASQHVRYERSTAERMRMILALGNFLAHLTSLGNRPQQATRFHCTSAPVMAIQEFVDRLATYFRCSDESLVVGGIVYIDRVMRFHPNFVVSRLSVHRLLAISIMVAAKFWDDNFYSNSHYARVGGLRTPELNSLELEFLELIDWKLQVVPEDYHWFCAKLKVVASDD